MESRRLYWVNTGSDSVQYYDFITSQVKTVHLNNDRPTAATVYRGKLYYANQDDNAIHVANKTTGADNSILRNNTGKFISDCVGTPAYCSYLHNNVGYCSKQSLSPVLGKLYRLLICTGLNLNV
jgi:hypothetical protein